VLSLSLALLPGRTAPARGSLPEAAEPSQIPASLGWYEIPNTKIGSLCPAYPQIQGDKGCAAVMADWSGALFDTRRNRLVIHGGGDADWYGNEIYAIDFNARPIAPLLVQDAAHGAALDNLGNCPEAFLDGTPNARHTYNGWLYLPTEDTYFLLGAGLAPCGNFSDSYWQFHPDTRAWTQTLTIHPNSAQNGSIPRFAYDPVTDSIFHVEANTGIFWQFTQDTNTWHYVTGVGACRVETSTTMIDPARRLYFCLGSGSFDAISLERPNAAKDLRAAPGCSELVNAPAPGFAYDPAQKFEVGWVKGDAVYTYNPDANSCSAITQFAGGPKTVQPKGTYGRFQYAPALGVFVLVNDISSDVYSLRLTPALSAK